MKYYLPKTEKPGKYGNKKTEYDGRKYDSKKEADHASFLDMLKCATNQADKVKSWAPQVRYYLDVNGVHICDYVADFVVTFTDGHVEVQDVKSEFTRKLPVYRLKKKLMKACRDIDIVEI